MRFTTLATAVRLVLGLRHGAKPPAAGLSGLLRVPSLAHRLTRYAEVTQAHGRTAHPCRLVTSDAGIPTARACYVHTHAVPLNAVLHAWMSPTDYRAWMPGLAGIGLVGVGGLMDATLRLDLHVCGRFQATVRATITALRSCDFVVEVVGAPARRPGRGDPQAIAVNRIVLQVEGSGEAPARTTMHVDVVQFGYPRLMHDFFQRFFGRLLGALDAHALKQPGLAPSLDDEDGNPLPRLRPAVPP